MGTVQISIKMNLLGKNRFCEYMGAGSSIPIGDEAVFLSDILRSGEKITHNELYICSHPHESSGAGKHLMMSYARGLTIRKVYGVILGGAVLIPFFFLRLRLFNYSFKHFRHYLLGFFKAKS